MGEALPYWKAVSVGEACMRFSALGNVPGRGGHKKPASWGGWLVTIAVAR